MITNEKRLIDVEQAKRATYEEIFWTESEQAVVRNFLAKLPKVDAVEVVRCKDCQYFVDTLPSGYGCSGFGGMTRACPNGFCSHGERKDNGSAQV